VSRATREARRDRYQEWLETHAFRYGFAAELAALSLNTRAGVANEIPPVERWSAIVPTVRLLERVRDLFGPTTIVSAYRSVPYNLAVGGVGDSRHAHNDAIDFRCGTGTPAQWATFLRGLRDAGQFAGGIGSYPRRGFVHVDTRGSAADWTG
jgi:uncharacterized protein YcbK (DUF882 family)